MKLIDYLTQIQSILPDVNESELESWLSEQGYSFDNTITLATEDFWACDLQVYCNPQMGRYALYQTIYHALSEGCLYVNIPSESAVEDLSDVLSQRLESINTYLNPEGRIQIVNPFLSDPENSSRRHPLQLWLVHQPHECNANQDFSDPKMQPLLDVDHVFLRAERDDDDLFVGYFVATRCGLTGNNLLSERWREQGWQLRKQENLSEWSLGCWEGDGRFFNLSC